MKVYLAVLVLLGWFALIAQFCISLSSGLAPTAELIIRYFSYFTITTNIMVALCSTTLLFVPQSKWGSFFSRQTIQAAITVYIVIVGIIYNTILRFIWDPNGLQRIVDELLHLIIPILFLIYWFVFVLKDRLKWNSFWPWLIYPLVYVIYIFIRGSFSGFYPYPFLDVPQFGFSQVLINSLGITLAFVVVSLLFIGFGKRTSTKRTSSN